MREDARFLSHTANSITNHQITKRRYRSAAANLTDADNHGSAPVASFFARARGADLRAGARGHVPGQQRPRHTTLDAAGEPTPTILIDTTGGPAPYPTVSDDVRISGKHKLAPQTLFKGPAGRELRRQMNRANPRAAGEDLLSRPFDRDTKPGGCRSVEGQQKTQDRLTWLAPPFLKVPRTRLSSGPPRTRGCQRRSPRGSRRRPPRRPWGDRPMVKATQSVSLDDAASWLSDAVPKELTGSSPVKHRRRRRARSCSIHHNATTRTSNQYYTRRSHSAGAYDDHERATLEKGARHASFCKARGSERPLGVLERHLSSI